MQNPNTEPHTRLQQARAHIGGIELFSRTDIHGKQIISMYDPESPALLLDPKEFYSDTFDALKFGRPLDPFQPFFEQWDIFSRSVPRPAIINDPDSENCHWCLYDIAFKNSYATYGGVTCDEVLYADMCIRNSHSVDVAGLVESEWSYESTQLFACSQAYWSEYCTNSLNITFCFGVSNCTDCFGCVNIKNKKYCFLNEQLSEEEYKKRIHEIDLSDSEVVTYWKEKTNQIWQQGYYMAGGNIRSEDVSGDDLVNCKEVSGISVFQGQRVYNAFDASYITDSCDISTSSNLERCVNSISCTDGYENKMCISCHGCIDIEYSELCISCEHCFGCIGLKRKQFCIFNVQYSEEEYWKQLKIIKKEMLQRGESGKFFPYSSSLLAYNTSHAEPFFPLSKEEACSLGARWYNFPTNTSLALVIESLPTKLADVHPEVLNQQFLCPESGRPYRIVKPELEFHKKMNLALPRQHPSIRRKKRYKKLLELRLYPQNCQKCTCLIVTRLPASKSTQFLCPECYNQTLLDDTKMLKIGLK